MKLGFYCNKTDDYISANDIMGFQKHLAWLMANKVNFLILYIDSDLLKKPMFKSVMMLLKNNKIEVGSAFGGVEKIQAVNRYNELNPTIPIKQIVSELEPYAHNAVVTYQEMTKLLDLANLNNKKFGYVVGVYMGRPDKAYWETIIQKSAFINLHCYLKNYSEEKIINYMTARLTDIANTAKRLNKKVIINLLVSNEPLNEKTGEEFGYKYFQVNEWINPYNTFINSWKKFPEVVRQWITVQDYVIFNTKYAKQIKPL